LCKLPSAIASWMCVLQVLGEPRAREMLPPQMSAEYVRKLLDVFRVSAVYLLRGLCCTCRVP